MNKIKYYLLQWTWGLPMNLIGLLVFIAAKLCCWRTYFWRKAICIILPTNKFSAINLGMFIVRGTMNESSIPHEYGHSIQNIRWGWLFLFVIGLPSLFRSLYYGFYYIFLYEKRRCSLPDYYSIWFEKEASILGRNAAQNKYSWL